MVIRCCAHIRNGDAVSQSKVRGSSDISMILIAMVSWLPLAMAATSIKGESSPGPLPCVCTLDACTIC